MDPIENPETQQPTDEEIWNSLFQPNCREEQQTLINYSVITINEGNRQTKVTKSEVTFIESHQCG